MKSNVSKLVKKELKQAYQIGDMAQSHEELSSHIKRSNDLIIKALYHADIARTNAQKFFDRNMDLYAPLNAMHTNPGAVPAAVQQWKATMKIVINRAYNLILSHNN